jgi:hypothetical protein
MTGAACGPKTIWALAILDNDKIKTRHMIKEKRFIYFALCSFMPSFGKRMV